MTLHFYLIALLGMMLVSGQAQTVRLCEPPYPVGISIDILRQVCNIQIDTPIILGCVEVKRGVCVRCDNGYILSENAGQCILERLIAQQKYEPLNIGQPLEDKVDQLDQRFGPTALAAHKYNLKTRPVLLDYKLVDGVSIPGVLGVHIVLQYENHNNIGNSDQVMTILFTDCSGKINQLSYMELQYLFQSPLHFIKKKIQQGQNFQFFQMKQITDDGLFELVLKKGDQYSKVSYYLRAEAEFSSTQTDLIDIMRPLAQNKVRSTNDQYLIDSIHYKSNITKINNNTVLFKFGGASLSMQLSGCNMVINQIVFEDINDGFYKSYEAAKRNSFISNIGAYKNIKLLENDDLNYLIDYKITDNKNKQINLQVRFSESTQEFLEYRIDGEDLFQEINQLKNQIEQNPISSGNNFTFILENPFCEVFKKNSLVCQKCLEDFDLRGGICYDKFCVFREGQSCLQCIQGHHLSAGRCSQNIQRCTAYNSLTDKCSKCQKGYHINLESICSRDSPIPSSCLNFDQLTLKCLQCKYGYKLEQGLCKDSCLKRNNNSICIQCQKGQIFYYGFCMKCPNGTNFRNQKCQELPPNCVEYDVFAEGDDCGKCKPGYRLDPSDKSCVYVGSCQDGYRLTKNQNCVKIPDKYLKIIVDFNSRNIPTKLSNFLNKSLILAKKFYENFLGATASQKPFLLPSNIVKTCGGYSIPNLYLNASIDADILILVNMQLNNAANFKISEVVCNINSITKAPNLGVITLNIVQYTKLLAKQQISSYIFQKQTWEIIRAFGTILGLSPVLVGEFGGNFNLDNGVFSTPLIASYIESHYNCKSSGMPFLVQNPMNLVIKWPYHLVGNELFTLNSPSLNPYISPLTAALFTATGWYSGIDYKFISESSWGKNKGCQFFNQQSCNFEEYCKIEGSMSYTYDRTGIGKCSNVQGSQCRTYVQQFSCLDSDYLSKTPNVKTAYEQSGATSKAFKSTLREKGTALTGKDTGVRCYPMYCGPKSNYVYIKVGQIQIACYYQNQVIQTPSLDGTIICPDNFKRICSSDSQKTCQQGIQINGKCLCQNPETCSNSIEQN